MSKKHNWEKLSYELREALIREIKEGAEKQEAIDELVLIVHYLEMKLGIYKDGYESV
jgi:hypothetical protein